MSGASDVSAKSDQHDVYTTFEASSRNRPRKRNRASSSNSSAQSDDEHEFIIASNHPNYDRSDLRSSESSYRKSHLTSDRTHTRYRTNEKSHLGKSDGE